MGDELKMTGNESKTTRKRLGIESLSPRADDPRRGLFISRWSTKPSRWPDSQTQHMMNLAETGLEMD